MAGATSLQSSGDFASLGLATEATERRSRPRFDPICSVECGRTGPDMQKSQPLAAVIGPLAWPTSPGRLQ